MATYNYRKSPSPQNGFYDQHYYEYYNETVDVSQRLPTIEEAREQYEAYNEYSLALSSMPYQDDRYQQYDDYYKHSESRQYHLHMVAILCLTLLTIVGLLFGAYWLLIKEDVFGRTAPPNIQVAGVQEQASSVTSNHVQYSGLISPVFSKEVQHWSEEIVRWAAQQGLDPDALATIMQIESCGNPNAASWAGAQGLFQVMPFHFTAGENMLDPDTNAYRGAAYFAERLVQTNGEIGLAFAGYNGGHGAAGSSWDYWAEETQDYYIWSTGIYNEAKSGATHSETLDEWMSYGGKSLCDSASAVLGIK